MKLLLAALLVLTLTGCGHNMDGHVDPNHNPLGGTTVTTITPSSSQDDHMNAIQAELKKMANANGFKDAFLYWTINDAQTKDNMAVYDITITIEDLRKRFIFGLTDGVIKMVKEIEVEAEVNCQHEADKYEGRDQA